MPANFSQSLKKPKVLKNSEACSLKRHFTGCARQVIGYLDLLAAQDPDRLVWASARSIAKRCKNYGKRDKTLKPTSYSFHMVKKVLQCFRDVGLISEHIPIEVQERRGFAVADGFIVAPHEAFTSQRPGSSKGMTVCTWVGPCRAPGTTWAFAEGGKFWFIAKKNVVKLPVKIVFRPGVTEPGRVAVIPWVPTAVTTPITTAITIPVTTQTDKSYTTGYPASTTEHDEDKALNADCDKVLRESSGPSLVSQSVLETDRPSNPPNPALSGRQKLTDENQRLGYGVVNEEAESKTENVEPPRKSTATPRKTTNDTTIAENENPAPSAPGPLTVRDFFGDSPIEYLNVITDGQLVLDNPTMKKFFRLNPHSLEQACFDVVKENGDLLLHDRRTLALLMGRVMDKMESRGERYPSPWLKVRSFLSAGGPILAGARYAEEQRSSKCRANPLSPEQIARRSKLYGTWEESEEGKKLAYVDLMVRAKAFDKFVEDWKEF